MFKMGLRKADIFRYGLQKAATAKNKKKTRKVREEDRN